MNRSVFPPGQSQRSSLHSFFPHINPSPGIDFKHILEDGFPIVKPNKGARKVWDQAGGSNEPQPPTLL